MVVGKIVRVRAAAGRGRIVSPPGKPRLEDALRRNQRHALPFELES